jgi:hypothetical protein
MANLPYTDGSNGNGITDIKELLTYYGKCPLAFLAYGFTDSYHSLFAQINPDVVLSLFDKVITPEELDHFPALQLADKPLEILGIRFCLNRFLSEGVLLSARHDRDWDMGAMLFNLKLQSPQQYPLCVKYVEAARPATYCSMQPMDGDEEKVHRNVFTRQQPNDLLRCSPDFSSPQGECRAPARI